ncbi:MAG: methylmalonyl-CoA mutase [Muricauda sp.]|jgi:methylmalonyl-CoA mutase|nr:methylmalonyl-CoA mutase subunit beta [Allomuricauda sp.]MBC31531.1 methylmalonyl-CoA mutase [Allomuricauda sp.]|tara:strand:+ start:3567 stop:4958 length:1392 start_codon:yes stop_codon:yes gene_type:complete
MKENSMFDEFEPVSAKQWKQKIQVDLKGADYNESLVWESLEGIAVKPFYHSEDLENKKPYPLSVPKTFKIAEMVEIGDAPQTKQQVLNALDKGAESLWFRVKNPSVLRQDVLAGVDLKDIALYFEFTFFDGDAISRLMKFFDGKTQLHLMLDPIGDLAKTGNWSGQTLDDLELLVQILGQANNVGVGSVLAVDTAIYQNAGANMVQQLAYALAHANEYLNRWANLSEREDSLPVTFKVAVGSNYFFEIAKLRALRLLWGTLAKEFGLKDDCHILGVPSRRNKTLYDYNVNMLRTTTECMSAILGGANTVCNLAYDALYHDKNDFADRIARNQLLILKNESYFDGAASATEGSYYIETLTNQLAEKGLELFKQLEKAGGFLNQLKEGTIQRKIKESAAKEQRLFDEGKLVLVGTNKYPNADDKMKKELAKQPFAEPRNEKTLIEPIVPKRLAEKLEVGRLNSED